MCMCECACVCLYSSKLVSTTGLCAERGDGEGGGGGGGFSGKGGEREGRMDVFDG